MTVSSTNRVAGPFNGNGVTTAFPFAFKVFRASDMLVKSTVGGVTTVRNLTSDYTVVLNGDQDANPGGNVNMLVAPPSGTTLTVTSQVPNLQPTDLTNLGGFYPAVINQSLDRLTIMIQQIASQSGLGVNLPLSVGNGGTGTSDAATARANLGIVAANIPYTPFGVGAVLSDVESGLRNQAPPVQNFGTVGTANDTAVLQLAINSCTGKALRLPAGTYYASNLVINGEINIIGDGYSLTQIRQIAGSTGDLITINGVRHPSMRHLSLAGTPTGRDCLNIKGASSGNQFIDCFFTLAGRDGANVNGTTDNAVFLDCIVEANGRDGIAFESATTNGLVAFGRFAAGTRYNIRAEGNILGPGHRFFSNTFAFGQNAIALINQNHTTLEGNESIQASGPAILLQGAQNCSISNNRLHSNNSHGIQTLVGNLLVLDTPVYVGTGNGTISILAILDRSIAVAETFTVTAISSTVFTVSGSVSGPQTGNNATVGTAWGGAGVIFLITAGGTPFVAGGVFTFHTSMGTQSTQYNNIVGNTMTLGGGNGLLLSQGSSLNNVIGNTITLNAIEGIRCDSSGENTIANNMVAGNGLTGTPKVGIHLVDGGSGASSNCRVLGNNITDLGIAGAQTTGILNAPTASNTLIENNNIVAATNKVSVTGGNIVARNNQGYITEAGGLATIASGTTSIVVNHGLSITPSLQGFSFAPAFAATVAPGEIYADTFTATQVTFRCRTNPGASGLLFGWNYSQ